jgi:hypothetical protein
MKTVETALQGVQDRVAERARNSPEGMREAASELRSKARTMGNSGDRDAMLRIAAGYETRAADFEKQQQRRRR